RQRRDSLGLPTFSDRSSIHSCAASLKRLLRPGAAAPCVRARSIVVAVHRSSRYRATCWLVASDRSSPQGPRRVALGNDREGATLKESVRREYSVRCIGSCN